MLKAIRNSIFIVGLAFLLFSPSYSTENQSIQDFFTNYWEQYQNNQFIELQNSNLSSRALTKIKNNALDSIQKQDPMGEALIRDLNLKENEYNNWPLIFQKMNSHRQKQYASFIKQPVYSNRPQIISIKKINKAYLVKLNSQTFPFNSMVQLFSNFFWVTLEDNQWKIDNAFHQEFWDIDPQSLKPRPTN